MKIAKRSIENEILDVYEEKKAELIEWVKGEEAQKLIYSVGALIGNGAKAGFGLNKKTGKLGLTDFLMQIGGKWIGGMLGMKEESEGKPAEETDKGVHAGLG